MAVRNKFIHFTDWRKVVEYLSQIDPTIVDESSARSFLTDESRKGEQSHPDNLYYWTCFVKNTKEIYTHGQIYDCSEYDDTEILNKLEELSDDLNKAESDIQNNTNELTALRDEVEENELVIAEALTELNNKIANSGVDLSKYVTKDDHSLLVTEVSLKANNDDLESLEAIVGDHGTRITDLTENKANKSDLENYVIKTTYDADLISINNKIDGKVNTADIATILDPYINQDELDKYQLKSTASDQHDTILAELNKKQDLLISGVNIKTINGADIMSGGNINTPDTKVTSVDNHYSPIAKVVKTGFVTGLSYDEKGHIVDSSARSITSTDIPDLDASKITSGTISIDRLPAGALERLYTVATESAAMSLTIQEGDVVRITGNDNKMYFCVSNSATTFASKFTEFTAGYATSVPWSGITDKPVGIDGWGDRIGVIESAYAKTADVNSLLTDYVDKTSIKKYMGWSQAHHIGQDIDSLYDFGVVSTAGNVNTPSTNAYGVVATFPYRNAYGNSIPDLAAQLYFPNGDEATPHLFWRNSIKNAWNNWRTILDSSNYSDYALPITGGTVNGDVIIRSQSKNRATLSLISSSDVPTDLKFGTLGSEQWSITSRAANEENALMVYNYGLGRSALYFNFATNEALFSGEINAAGATVRGNILATGNITATKFIGALDAERLDDLNDGTIGRLFHSVFQPTNTPGGANYFAGLTFGYDSIKQLAMSQYGKLYSRYSNKTTWSNWREVAFVDNDSLSPKSGTLTVNGEIALSHSGNKSIIFPEGEYIDQWGNIRLSSTSGSWNVFKNDQPLLAVETNGSITANGHITSNSLTVNNTRFSTVNGMPAGFEYGSGVRGTKIWSNGISMCDPILGSEANDAGWIRHIEETKNEGTLEIAVGDDNANESIKFRYYNTSNEIGNEILLPRKTGTLALLTDNVASATKLQTSRSIWGQSFDGSGNITGNFTTTGNITASGTLTLNGTTISYDKTKNAFVLPANLVVQGDVACTSTLSSFDPNTITESVMIDGSTIKRNSNGTLYVNSSALGTIPTKLSQLTDDVVSGHYLPTSGGTINGNLVTLGTINANGITVNGTVRATSFISDIFRNMPLSEFNATSVSIDPNKYYRLTAAKTSLTITLNTPADNTILNEYFIEFPCGGSVSLPSGLIWANGKAPEFESGATYQISIVNNLAIFTKFAS